jgi:HSP20 family protein
MTKDVNREHEPHDKAVSGPTGQAVASAQRSGQELGPSRTFGRGPFALMRRLSDEMDRLFGAFLGPIPPSELNDWNQPSGWWPAMEVARTNGEIVVRADLPGVSNEDVTLEVDENRLVLRGERRHEHESHDGGIQRSERSYGSFYRAIPLPEGAEVDEAEAEFRNGVLEIRVPAPQRTRRIPIATEAEA